MASQNIKVGSVDHRRYPILKSTGTLDPMGGTPEVVHRRSGHLTPRSTKHNTGVAPLENSCTTFFRKILGKLTRSSHQYVYDMLCAYRDAPRREGAARKRRATTTALFAGELFGIDSALERVIDYFKAAAAGSDVADVCCCCSVRRRAVILARDLAEARPRGIQPHRRRRAVRAAGLAAARIAAEYDSGSMRPRFRATYGVDIQGELSPYARARLDDEFQGRLHALSRRAYLPVRSGASRRRHVCAARSDDGGHRRPGRLGRLVEGRRIGDEGDPRAWSWSGAVYAASRGVLEMSRLHLEHAAARGVDGARPRPARGSPSSPMAATFDKSTEPTRSAMSAVVGSCGAYVPTPTRAASDKKMRSTGKRMKSPLTRRRADARVRRQLALNVDAVRGAKPRPQARRNQVQRRFVQRRALQRVQRAFVGVAVFLEPALQQDHERGLAARRRPQQQQQSSAHVGARGGGLEVVDDALERTVDAEELAGEQRGRRARSLPSVPRPRGAARRVRAEHVVNVLMRRARQLRRIFGRMSCRNSAKVPRQCCAWCCVANVARSSMNEPLWVTTRGSNMSRWTVDSASVVINTPYFGVLDAMGWLVFCFSSIVRRPSKNLRPAN